MFQQAPRSQHAQSVNQTNEGIIRNNSLLINMSFLTFNKQQLRPKPE